ncbi:MAG: rhamnose ABC transporter substrate-binding protein [Spirochaetales bacterium]|nr:rhamnose ABC transporter substrate-binding protein [Spirochaetales bacterium]
MKSGKILTGLLIMLFCSGTVIYAENNIRIALIVKNLGNSFFEACRDGGLEAVKELGGSIDLIYHGPITPTVAGQIEIIASLIEQKVNGIAISANDIDALVPVCKKAMKAGIKVISFDSAIGKAGRILHLDPSSPEYIGRSQVKMMADMIGYRGEIAILSASPQASNQNIWIEYMKKELGKNKYDRMKLVSVVYGDDLSDKSYREALKLFNSFPELKGIISPTVVGLASTAKAIEDAKLKNRIELTGLGLPSQLKAYIKKGICKKMSLWNPIDLGYSAVYITYKLISGEFNGKAGEVMPVGRMGNITVDKNNNAVMAEPFVFDAKNIDKFAAIY